MKKLVSILCTAAMLAAAAVLPAASVQAEEEFETETITSLDGFDIKAGNAEIVEDTVDGVEQPVIKWTYDPSSSECDFGTQLIPAVAGGTYRLTVKYYCPQNPGQGRFGMRSTADGGFPSNSPEGMITANETYTTFTRDVTVQENNTSEQYVRMRFTNGDPGDCYIAEFKAQPVLEDGSLGENILPEFYTERIKGTTEGWTLIGAEDHGDTLSIDYSTSGSRPAALWRHLDEGTGNHHLRYTLPALEKGDYRISITYYAPQNPGNGRIGIRNDSNGGFPDNNTEKTITQNTGYETKTRDVTVTNDEIDYQFLDIDCSYGAQGQLYISEVKLQKINDDGTLGENLITNGDFMQRKLPDPDPIETENFMFDIVDESGSSMTGGNGIGYVPPVNAYPLSTSVDVKNNTDSVITPVLIQAIYYDGVLCDINTVQSEIAVGESENMSVRLSIPDTVGQGKLTAKAFLWEDTGSMKPVTSSRMIVEQ